MEHGSKLNTKSVASHSCCETDDDNGYDSDRNVSLSLVRLRLQQERCPSLPLPQPRTVFGDPALNNSIVCRKQNLMYVMVICLKF